MEEKAEVLQKMKEIQHSVETVGRDHDFALSQKDLELVKHRESNAELGAQIQKLRVATTELVAKTHAPNLRQTASTLAEETISTTDPPAAMIAAAVSALSEGSAQLTLEHIDDVANAVFLQKVRELQPSLLSGTISPKDFVGALTVAAHSGSDEQATSVEDPDTSALVGEIATLREQLTIAKTESQVASKDLHARIAIEKAAATVAVGRVTTLEQHISVLGVLIEAAKASEATQSDRIAKLTPLEKEISSLRRSASDGIKLSARVAELEAAARETDAFRAAATEVERLQAKLSKFESARVANEQALVHATRASAEAEATKAAAAAAKELSDVEHDRASVMKKVSALEKVVAHTEQELKVAQETAKRLRRESKQQSRLANEEGKHVKDHEAHVAALEQRIKEFERMASGLGNSPATSHVDPAVEKLLRDEEVKTKHLRAELTQMQSRLDKELASPRKSKQQNLELDHATSRATTTAADTSHAITCASFLAGGIAVAAYFLAVAPQSDTTS
jgi:hypothetical protein